MKTLKHTIYAFVAAAIMACAAMPVMAGEATAQQMVVSQPSIKVAQGHIIINIPGDEAKQVVVYALTGQVVKSVNLTPGSHVVELPAGYYIVKIDRYSQKVIIK